MSLIFSFSERRTCKYEVTLADKRFLDRRIVSSNPHHLLSPPLPTKAASGGQSIKVPGERVATDSTLLPFEKVRGGLYTIRAPLSRFLLFGKPVDLGSTYSNLFFSLFILWWYINFFELLYSCVVEKKKKNEIKSYGEMNNYI